MNSQASGKPGKYRDAFSRACPALVLPVFGGGGGRLLLAQFPIHSKIRMGNCPHSRAKLSEPARGAYVLMIPGKVTGGRDQRKKKGEGGRGEIPPAAVVQNAQPAEANAASQPRRPTPPPLPGDGCGRTKRQAAGERKALRLRFALKGRQPRACRQEGWARWAQLEQGCSGPSLHKDRRGGGLLRLHFPDGTSAHPQLSGERGDPCSPGVDKGPHPSAGGPGRPTPAAAF